VGLALRYAQSLSDLHERDPGLGQGMCLGCVTGEIRRFEKIHDDALPKQLGIRGLWFRLASHALGDDDGQRACQDKVELGAEHDFVGTELLVGDCSNRAVEELPQDDARTAIPGSIARSMALPQRFSG